MDEATFKATFAAAFLAAWCVKEYDGACFRGEHDRLRNPPADDAIDLSESAWRKYQDARQ